MRPRGPLPGGSFGNGEWPTRLMRRYLDEGDPGEVGGAGRIRGARLEFRQNVVDRGGALGEANLLDVVHAHNTQPRGAAVVVRVAVHGGGADVALAAAIGGRIKGLAKLYRDCLLSTRFCIG